MMIFDHSHEPAYSNLPAPLLQRMVAAFLRNREAGTNVQFIDPESGKLCENSFSTEQRRDQFIAYLERQGIDCITSDCTAYGK